MSHTTTWIATLRAKPGLRLSAHNAERVRKQLADTLATFLKDNPPHYDVGEDLEDLELTVTVNSVRKQSRPKSRRK